MSVTSKARKRDKTNKQAKNSRYGTLRADYACTFLVHNSLLIQFSSKRYSPIPVSLNVLFWTDTLSFWRNHRNPKKSTLKRRARHTKRNVISDHGPSRQSHPPPNQVGITRSSLNPVQIETVARELKQPQRRRQRKRKKKNNWFY